MQELWDDRGRIDAEKVGPAAASRIEQLLRVGEVSFVVADIGHPLRWIARQGAAAFWKAEVKDHLAESERIYLEEFSGGYAFSASEWRRANDRAVILLEVHH